MNFCKELLKIGCNLWENCGFEVDFGIQWKQCAIAQVISIIKG